MSKRSSNGLCSVAKRPFSSSEFVDKNGDLNPGCLFESVTGTTVLKYAKSLTGKPNTVLIAGQPSAIQNFIENSSALNSLPGSMQVLRNQLPNMSPGAKGSLANGIVHEEGKDPKEMLKLYTLLLPSEASRHNCSARPDALCKQMLTMSSELQSSCSDEELARNVHVYVCCQSIGDVFPLGSAVARAMPRYSRKTNRGKDIKQDQITVSVSFHVADGQIVDQERLDRLSCVSDGIRTCQALVDAAPNELNCTTYADFAVGQAVALKSKGVSAKVIKGKDLAIAGFGGLWNVGRGCTPNPPALVHLSHYPEGCDENSKSVVLVGKGIVFDTGGLSVKPTAGMCGMKRDMGGSAGLLGAFLSVVNGGGLPNKQPFHVVLCLAENSVSADSFRNDDIIKLYSGLTAEINNTDAEGRLVLADGVAYAGKHLNPELVVDMATLTGAGGIATGIHHGAIVSNDEATESSCVEAGKSSGDLVHPMLYCPEFHKVQYKSEFADMKNSVSVRTDAQVSCAGHFIGENLFATGYEGAWLHIDMAYPVNYFGERATGYGVSLINELLLRARK